MSSADTHSDPRWRRLPEERPRQILDAAVQVFAEHGLAEAKLDEIATRAGVSKGTIYLYFPSKEDLFREVVRQTVVPNIAEAEGFLDEGTATDQLRRYISNQWNRLSNPAAECLVRVVLLELHKFPDLAEFYGQEVVARSNRTLGEIIRRGVASGEFRPIEPMTAVAMIKAIMLMHVLWFGPRSDSSRTKTRTREQIEHDISDFIFHALRPVAGAAEPGVNPE